MEKHHVLNLASPGRALLGATACVLALAGPVRHGEAAFVGCRADPILHLSNGGALRVSATIGADRRAIGRITYTVRVPRGLRLLATTYTGGPLGTRETVHFSADNAPDTFSTDTLVSTLAAPAGVTASIAVQGARGTATGHSGDHLLITVHLRVASPRAVKDATPAPIQSAAPVETAGATSAPTRERGPKGDAAHGGSTPPRATATVTPSLATPVPMATATPDVVTATVSVTPTGHAGKDKGDAAQAVATATGIPGGPTPTPLPTHRSKGR